MMSDAKTGMPAHVGRGDPHFRDRGDAIVPYEGMSYLDVDTGQVWIHIGGWRRSNPISEAIAQARDSIVRGEVASVTFDTDELPPIDADDRDAIVEFYRQQDASE